MTLHKFDQPISRRTAAKTTLKAVLVAGASVLGLMSATGSARAGYGECSVSGCNCKNYMGNDNTCSNCGHSFQLHW
jgi:hypothetical protein